MILKTYKVYQEEEEGQTTSSAGDEEIKETPAEVIKDEIVEEIDDDSAAFEELAESMLSDDDGDEQTLELKESDGTEAKDETSATEESPKEDKEKSDESDPDEDEQSQNLQKKDEEKEEITPTPTAEDLQKQYTDQRKQSVDDLSPMFAMTDEDAELLKSDPGKVMPKLAAELFYDTHEAVVRSITSLFPTMLKQFTDAQAATQTQEATFFEQWPALKDDKFRENIIRVANVYRATNPSATPEQFVREVGAQLMVANKIPFNMETGGLVKAAATQATSTAHKPAIPSSTAQPNVASTNEFEILTDEMDEFDRS